MHDDEVVISDETVRGLIEDQLPAHASDPIVRLAPTGTDNQLFRLGEDLVIRMPRIPGAASAPAWEHRWLPALAPHLSIPIPAPLVLGRPGHGYPWAWTVVPWFDGQEPTPASIDLDEWAVGLGSFVRELRRVPAMNAPVKDEGRGGPLASLDEWVRRWTARVDPSVVDRQAVLALWEDALAAPAWSGEPVWFHGDLHEGNLVVRDGRLRAVIDWGVAGRGDPAVELNVMWGFLPESVAELYRDTVGLDAAAYRRGRGHALAPAISGVTYYRDSAPHLSALGLAAVQALLASS